MAESSRFAASRVTTKGRTFPARITEVEEQTKTFTDNETGKEGDVTQLMLRFERNDGKYELEWYRIPDGDEPVTMRSDLGKLINYFSRMKIPDIGVNDYEPIRDLYVWVEVFPRTNRRTNESTDKRFPVRLMAQPEIQQHFGPSAGASGAAAAAVDIDAVLNDVSAPIVEAIGGITPKGVFSKIATITEVADHENAEAIFEAAHSGELVKWLEAKKLISIGEDGNIAAGETADAGN